MWQPRTRPRLYVEVDIPILCRCILYTYYAAVSHIIVILCRCVTYYWYPCYIMPLYRISLVSLLYYAAVSHIIDIPVILCRCIAYYWLRERSSVLQGVLQLARLTGSLSTSCHPCYLMCGVTPPPLIGGSDCHLPPIGGSPPHVLTSLMLPHTILQYWFSHWAVNINTH